MTGIGPLRRLTVVACQPDPHGAALALLGFNVVAATSYPELSAAGLKDHILWGALLLVVCVYGPGKLSLDHMLARRLGVRR